MASQAALPKPRRIDAIDLARGLALLAMASYHFTWDLEFFGYLDPGFTAAGAWKFYARTIASSFLFLTGISLYLAHGGGIRWRGFGRRLAMVAGAAAVISAVTWFAVPNGFIFFGILHQIALASLLGLAFLRLPALATLAMAAVVVGAAPFLRSAFFDPAAWWWLGLAENVPRSNDYVPLFPWFGAVLAGIGVAQVASRSGLLAGLAKFRGGGWARPLRFLGRHSLAFYLIHQPLLIGGLWLFSQMSPPRVVEPEIPLGAFLELCNDNCREAREIEFCAAYCDCMLDALERENALASAFENPLTESSRVRLESMANSCTASTEQSGIGGPLP